MQAKEQNQAIEAKKSWMIPVLEEAGLEVTKAGQTGLADGVGEFPGSV